MGYKKKNAPTSVPNTVPHPTQTEALGWGEVLLPAFWGRGHRVRLGYSKQKYQKLTLLSYCEALIFVITIHVLVSSN